MVVSVKDILESQGPGLTGEVIETLVENGVSKVAARKRVERANFDYTRLAGVRFAKNARFIYLDHQYGGKDFWKAVERAFEKAGTSYWHMVNGLRARGGRCKASYFPIVASAPKARKSQLSPARILERLCDVNLLEVRKLTNDVEYVQFQPNIYHKISEERLLATHLAETILLNAVITWSQKLGFGSYNQFQIRTEEELPIVSGLAWDMSAPSYIRPLRQVVGGKLLPAFFVCDVNLNGPLSEGYVLSFIHKHDVASAPRNVAPILPLLVGDVFTQAAYDLAKQKGIMAVTVADLFGDDVRKALQDLINLMSDAGATVSVNPQHLAAVLNSLSKIEGSANNLRGTLFEFVAGSLLKDIESEGYLEIGKKHTDFKKTGDQFEIDILLNQEDKNRVLIVECKSKIPGSLVSLEEVKRWHNDRVPLIYRTLKDSYRLEGREFIFELWSNGGLHAQASNWLENQKPQFNEYKVGWKDGPALKAYSNKAKSSAIRQALKDHYFTHAYSKVRSSNRSVID